MSRRTPRCRHRYRVAVVVQHGQSTEGGLCRIPGVGRRRFVDDTTVGRFAQPTDVAAVAAFLAADESSFVSAATYLVDGGAATKRYPDLPAAIARARERGGRG